MKIKNLLVPLDGSANAEQALPHAEELARAFGARITLLRVGGAMAPEALGLPELSMAFASELQLHQAKVENDLMSYLEHIAAPLRDKGLDVSSEVRTGDAPAAIVELADSEHVDLVVMTSHGRGGLARWFYGSVAERVMGNVSCSLLVVRVSKDVLKHD